MSHSGAEAVGLDTLMNAQPAVKDVGSVVSRIDTNLVESPQPPSAVGTGNGVNVTDLSTPASQPNTHNRVPVSSLGSLDLTRPVKTEGEASPNMSTVSHTPPTGGVSILPASQSHATTSSTAGPHAASSDAPTTPSSSLPVSVASIGTFGAFGSTLTALGSQLNLTSEEQAAAYKKANILALSALAKKGGPNAREMLAVQAKLQEFLTNLISLAGNSGQQLKSTVQMLVQQLVVSLVMVWVCMCVGVGGGGGGGG